MALNDRQKRKAREALARKRGVDASSISDSDISAAITAAVISTSDYGSSSYDCGSSSSYDGGGSSYSSSDSGCY